MKNKLNIPDSFGDFEISYIAETENVIAIGSMYLKGQTALEIMTGKRLTLRSTWIFHFMTG